VRRREAEAGDRGDETRVGAAQRHDDGAGAGVHNILKCQLRPLDRGEYDVAFTDDQWQRLQQAFPDGVCDYRKPGVGQQPSVPWLTYAGGPGGEPLGPAPTSAATGPGRTGG
jgi:hypothetical protein